jgi:hypothetical protein
MCGPPKGNSYPSLTVQGEQIMTAQHVDDNGLHIEKLDRRLRELSATFAGLGKTVAQQTATNAAQQRAALRDGVLLIAEGADS